ncbi:GD19582 [Drosophila simulans]|uniref:GD19582 n=1 Tax=Drosophila simulans TaxID=7240 RepID=B4QXJ7_DROSI|nr:GD19582 [Drosophila simulans]
MAELLRSPVIPTPPRDLSVPTIIRIAQSQSSIPNRIQSPSPTMSIADKRASFARRAESLVERVRVMNTIYEVRASSDHGS